MPWLEVKVDGIKYFNGSVWYKTFMKVWVGLYYEHWGKPTPKILDDIMAAADEFESIYPRTAREANRKKVN